MADVRIPELPDYSSYGTLSNVDEIILYMVGANKTVRVPISAIASLLAASAATALASPVLSLSVVADDEIDASWSAVTNATNYKLYRSETPSFNDADLIYTGSGLLFNDTGRAAATQYFYWLQATGSGYADSAYSNSTATTTGAGADVTPPVYSTIEVSTTNPNQIKITYNETLQSVPSATTTQWSIPGKSCTFAAISGSVVTLTFNSNFVPGETPLLTYTGNQVKDIAGNLAATFTNQAVTNGLAVTAVRLSTPDHFKATPASTTQVNLTWDNVGNESSYRVRRSTDGSTFTVIATPATDVTSYNDTGRSAGTLYWYDLIAVGDGTNFTDSLPTTASATTPASSGAEYDTILTFVTATQDSDAQVNGTVPATNATQQFQFNSLLAPTGTGMRMTLREISGLFRVPKVVINFPSAYLGKPFKYIHSNGAVYTNFFTDGNLDFDLE